MEKEKEIIIKSLPLVWIVSVDTMSTEDGFLSLVVAAKIPIQMLESGLFAYLNEDVGRVVRIYPPKPKSDFGMNINP